MKTVTRRENKAFSVITGRLGNTRRDCARGQYKNLNGTRRANTIPASYRKTEVNISIAPSTVGGLVAEPLLTVEIGGEGFLFMVDTGALVSLNQPK